MTGLLCVDVGNTNVVLGLFDGDELREQWRIATLRHATEDELELQLDGLLGLRSVEVGDVAWACLSTTVPKLARPWTRALDRVTGADTLVVGPGVRTGLPIDYENPREVGPDRIVNAVAAHALHGAPCIVVDFGTSTNFDVVSPAGAFAGGAIAPGIEVSMDALLQRAARLGGVELEAPERAIGRNTVAAMQSGAVFGFAGQIDGIVRRMQTELGVECPVIATGGLADVVVPHTETVTASEPNLTMVGLRLIHERNRD